ncbi:MAG: hypothetical protein JNL75_05875 [Chitinophagales bacterium]|nr:hypothetical protein [Chitinophagales bacterium]
MKNCPIVILFFIVSIFSCAESYHQSDHLIRDKIHTAEDALVELKYGNNRFLDNQLINTDYHNQIEHTKKHQAPHSFILSCIDSRIPPEIIFDQGIGNLFVARVAGNIENSHILGSMEYAVKFKGTKLIVVMGHGSCGAINGSLDKIHIGNLSSIMEDIEISHTDDHRVKENESTLTCLNNIHTTMNDIRKKSKIIDSLLVVNQIQLVGAYYDIKSGEVRFLDD